MSDTITTKIVALTIINGDYQICEDTDAIVFAIQPSNGNLYGGFDTRSDAENYLDFQQETAASIAAELTL